MFLKKLFNKKDQASRAHEDVYKVSTISVGRKSASFGKKGMPSEMEVKEFVTRMTQIPPVDSFHGEGFDAIHKIGEEIDARWSKPGMQLVLQYYREHIPHNSATIPGMIERIWDGIGWWMA